MDDDTFHQINIKPVLTLPAHVLQPHEKVKSTVQDIAGTTLSPTCMDGYGQHIPFASSPKNVKM